MSDKVLAAQELRIGNILQYYIGEEGYDWAETIIDWQDIKWASELPENFNKVHKPIPLTEEWLVGFGFIKDMNNFWLNLQTHYLELIITPDGFYPIYAQLPEMSSEAEQRVGLNKIEYVHSLMNLYFALTGNELKVK